MTKPTKTRSGGRDPSGRRLHRPTELPPPPPPPAPPPDATLTTECSGCSNWDTSPSLATEGEPIAAGISVHRTESRFSRVEVPQMSVRVFFIPGSITRRLAFYGILGDVYIGWSSKTSDHFEQ
ncbi:uncharacterized protein LOC126088408 [Schistocerca cancellata]|uniref:uncharacterized protein LOC126088408 n=1 Tax=Schistocerca cancellata TaxID=274614 RepID=UPI0021176030|nr:uncharacterized protein LOC126088408 [Schistocerca cancellata]